MPSPYRPPLNRRVQAVQSARGRAPLRWRWAWLVPLAGLVPVLAVVVLASNGRLGAPSASPPVAAAPTSGLAAQGSPRDPAPPAAQTAQTAPAAQGPTPVASNASGGAAAAGQAATAAPATTASGQAATAAPVTTPAGQAATSTQTASSTQTGTSTTGGTSAPAAQGTADLSVASGPFRTYRVQPGDTVKFIAQMYGVSSASIAQASGLRNADVLRVGQVLTIPSQPGWLYRVQPGETLDQIAARTGVPTEIIVSATGSIRAGDVILIPDRSSAASK